MTEKIQLLDHGYVKLIETWGSGEAKVDEAGIVEAARQSTQGSFRGWDKDERLLRYLFMGEPQHSSPFEFCGMVIEVQAPMFVFREWHRHRTQSYNEMSARYAPIPDMNYIPSVERLMQSAQPDDNKQAGVVKGSPKITEKIAKTFRANLDAFYYRFQEDYEWALKNGVAKELARIGMPVGRYSRMRAHANLRNWLAFLTLRMHPDAQYEIREYAKAVGVIISEQFPKTWSLFEERRNYKFYK